MLSGSGSAAMIAPAAGFAVPLYLLSINVVGFVMAAFDKAQARKQKRRVPEKMLFAVALFGGSAGMYLSMRLFHHKTKHKRFMIGLPAILLAQAAALYAAWRL